MLSAIDQKHGGFDIVFLAEFSQKNLSQRSRCRRKQPQMQQVVCVGISRSIQPELLIIDSNHSFVDRNVIRVSAV